MIKVSSSSFRSFFQPESLANRGFEVFSLFPKQGGVFVSEGIQKKESHTGIMEKTQNPCSQGFQPFRPCEETLEETGRNLVQKKADRLYDQVVSLRTCGNIRQFMDALNRLEAFEKANRVVAS